jgi:uncharacterized lipoprotein YddW (UPF0748 family)
MKSKTRFLAAALFLVLIMTGMGAINPGSEVKASSEVRATWISYIDFDAAGLKDISEADFRTKVSAIYSGIAGKNLNTVYVHARAFNDAIYPSENFGWSEYITSNKSGPGYDPLAIMVELAHQKGLRIEAWMNPYRVSTSSARTSYIKSAAAPAELARMLEYVSSAGQSCLVLNPADAEVRRMIAQEAGYIVKNYDVDGIHFDDYFYDSAYYGSTTAAERRTYVNDLVSNVYSEIKSVDSSVEFGISPAGNVNDCLEDGADVKTWLSGTGYIDYLVPQIYWSDSYGAAGTTTMFSNRLNEFLSINKNGTDMYVGLALYKVASKPSLSTDPGWSSSSENLAKQVEYAVSKGVKGFSLFSSTQLTYQNTQTELNNLMDMVRSEVTLNGISPGQLVTTSGKQETFTVDARGGTGLLYQYHIYNYQTGAWTMVRDYSTNPSLAWTFDSAGKYQVMCFIRDEASGNWYDKAAYCEVEANNVPEIKVNGMTPSQLTAIKGKQETMTVDASGGAELLYQFHIYDYDSKVWGLIRDYSTNPTISWTFNATGRYQIMCLIKDKYSNNWYDKAAYCEATVDSNIPPVILNGITPSQLATTTGKQETVTVSASGGTNQLRYRYYIYNYQTRLWAMVRGDNAEPTLKWTFVDAGKYQIMCFIKDIESTNSYDAVAYCETTVAAPEVSLNGISPSRLTTYAGRQETVTVSAAGGTELLYQYHIYNYQTGAWTMVRDYSADPSLAWTFSTAGSYQIMCFVRDRNSANWYDKAAYCETVVK